MKCKLKLLLQVAEMSSSSYHDACKRAYKEYPRELIDAIISIRDDNPDYGYRRVTQELRNRGFALMLDLRTDFSLPCKLIVEEHFLYDSIFTRI